MSLKYRGLPDIDTAADVFETADEPESLLKPNDSDGEENDKKTAQMPVSDALDQSGLPDRRKAGRVFGKDTRKLPRFPPLQSFSDDNDSDSDADPDVKANSRSRPLESTAARIRRLKAELAEVESSISSAPNNAVASSSSTSTATPQPSTSASTSKANPQGRITRKSVLPPRAPVNLVEELSELKERLEKLDGRDLTQDLSSKGPHGNRWKEQLQQLQSTEKGKEQIDLNEGAARQEGTASSSSSTSTVPLSELDKRLAALEGTIGQVEPRSPLLPTVDRLDHILSLLTQPRHLDAISRRVKLLLVDMDRAAAAAKRNPTSTTSPDKTPSSVTLSPTEHAQLDSLFALLPRLDPLLPIIPPLLNRLQSLSGLHAEAADVMDGLRRLQSDEGDSAEEIRDLQRLASSVQDGLTESVKGIERNWTGIEARLTSLEERLKSL